MLVFAFIIGCGTLVLAGMIAGYIISAVEQGIILRNRRKAQDRMIVERVMRPTRGKGNARWRAQQRWPIQKGHRENGRTD